MPDEECLYAVLGVAPDADFDTLRAAWRALAAVLHPDRNPDPEAHARFQRVSAAWAVLSCPDQRLVYDRFGLHAVPSAMIEEVARALREAQPPPAPKPRKPSTAAPGAIQSAETLRHGHTRSTRPPTDRPRRSRPDHTGRTWWGGSSMDGLFGRRR